MQLGLTKKSTLSRHAGQFLGAVVLCQPLLDVLSYFTKNGGATAFTAALRLIMLVAVSAYGFAVSDRKQLYAAGYAVIAGFWFLHMLNCMRVGYVDPAGDTAEYLKLVQFPLWTMSFVSVFRKRDNLDTEILGALTANLVIILLVIGFSYITGSCAYTYEFPERDVYIGVLGWFGVPNAQSAILSIMIPGIILWALRSEKLTIFCVVSAAGFGLLYLTGTKLTYYTAIITAISFIAIVFLCRQPLSFAIPLAAVVVLFVALRGFSPMAKRAEVSNTSFSVYQEKIDAIMTTDKDFKYVKGQEISPAVKGKIKRVYEEIYGSRGVYDEVLLEDLIAEFGVDRVMEKMDYTVDPHVLNNSRMRKLTAMEMVWEKSDTLTRLFGLEYSDNIIGEHIYDPENDFPALLYYTGYVGTALYCLFAFGLLAMGLVAFIKVYPSLLTPEFIAASMMCVLCLGAAQLSGQVLRRPNVTVYFSLAAAQLYILTRETPPPSRLRPGHSRNPAISIKKLKI